MLSRRQFIQLGAGSAVSIALYGCSSSSSSGRRAASTASTASTASPSSPESAATAPVAASSTTSGASLSTPGPRTLVIIQLNGGNDGLNTLVPSDGRYRDARPTLAIPEADLVALNGMNDWSLHPQLAPLGKYWDAGHVNFLPGIGFSDPNHSHFVSLDRWWRADDLSARTGWLGRSITGDGTKPLYATALGSSAPLLIGDHYQAAVVLQPASFDFPKALPSDRLQMLTSPVDQDPLLALAQRSLASSIDAVASFQSLHDTSTVSGDQVPEREGNFNLVEGLDVAARLVLGDVGARIVVVSVGGFDTHSNQLATHKVLYADLAAGIDGFLTKVAAAGRADDTLLVTTSEFGRRVGENASGGFDHGAGGLSMMFGPMVKGGVLTTVDLGDQLDGDVRPVLDPRTMYTACLDWIGADPTASLG